VDNRDQLVFTALALPNQLGEIRTSPLKYPLEVSVFVAMALLLGCAGFSISNKSVAPSGTGTSQHTVELSWNASTSSNVRGYNVYRATYTDSCGAFSRINAELIMNTWYTDTDVTDGAFYCYATTAIDASNAESGYSNIVSDVRIPAS
jgi:hypothetical protein